MDLSTVRIREHFGLVSNDTHIGQFCFLVSPPKNRGSVEKHDYVLVDHPLLGEIFPVLAVIKEIIRLNNTPGSKPDQIDHLGNRRVRTQNELMQNRLRVGLMRMERIIFFQERLCMSSSMFFELSPILLHIWTKFVKLNGSLLLQE